MSAEATLASHDDSSYRASRAAGRAGIYAALWFGVILMIVPFLWMISTSLKSPIEILSFPPTWIPTGHFVQEADGSWEEVYVVSENEAGGTVVVTSVDGAGERTVDAEQVVDRVRLRFGNYLEAWRQAPFGRYYFNTIFVTLFVVAGVLVTSSLAAYAFARMKFWGRENLFVLFLSMMMVPQPVYIVPSYIILVKLGMVDTYQALIIPWIAHIFSIFLLRQHFRTIPNDLYDAAIIDGCSRLGFLWRIVLPLSKAVLVAVVIFTIVGTWNSFLWPLVMTNSPEVRPLQVGLARFSQEQGTNHELMMAAATFSVAPLIIAYFFAQKQIIQSLATSGLKS
ncbi:MAG: ABC transporter permease subunit [Candidatus Eisenbacteria bacterium]|nr:ABC transporter permease subunit [Candidatus Eisenbacteria bacterium]